MTGVKEHLAAAFFIMIGLITSGCGDSATVNPEATLANLTVTIDSIDATLNPVFNPATTSYTVQLSNNVTTVTVSAQPAVAGDSVTINGQATTSKVIDLGPPVVTGSTTLVNITVSDPPNTSKTYTVLLGRAPLNGNNSLQSLTVSSGTLVPDFNPNTLNYTVDVANNVGTIGITPTLDDSNATMTVNGQPTNSGQTHTVTLGPAGGTTDAIIVVSAQNGSPKTYTIRVSRETASNNNLNRLTVSPGRLSPTFAAATTIYTVEVASSVERITVTPTRQDPNASITVNGQTTNSGEDRTIELNPPGQRTIILIMVTAQNGSQKPYTMTVNRAALGGNNNLRSLTVSPGTLAPAFSASTTTYTVDVGSSVERITVTPRLEDTAATMTVNGQATTSGQARTITLNGAGSNTLITIIVTAPNNTQKTYTVDVRRAALGGNNNLRSLTVSPGTLRPTFTAARTAYTVSVGHSETSITVDATPQDPNATVEIDQQAGNSRSIPLPTGPSTTEIDVRVIAPNGTDKTYLITVSQPEPAAPPAPTSKPDLITEDDSCAPGIPPDECAPGTSREDDITNVTTPRFKIAQPGADQTASLYVDGVKVESQFDSGANTLRPVAALSDGTHTITYTMTNAGGESGPSPSLTVTIDTGAPGTPT
jgi:hypothetical protein